jgi:cytochrome b
MSSQDADSSMVKVWDPLVRVFHWSLVFLFLLAFITEDDWLDLHVLAGYAVSFLIGFRLLWGLVGTRNALVVLLLSVALVSFTGMTMVASEGQGPLAGTFFSSWDGDWMEEVHEFFANFTLLMVFAHVSGVLASSLLEGENLVKAMVTGRKKYRAYWEDVNPGKGEENQS